MQRQLRPWIAHPRRDAFGKPGAPTSVQDLIDDTGWFVEDAWKGGD